MKKITGSAISILLCMLLITTPVYAACLGIEDEEYFEAASGSGSGGGAWSWDGNEQLKLDNFKSDKEIYTSDHLNIELSGSNEVPHIDAQSSLTITGDGSLTVNHNSSNNNKTAGIVEGEAAAIETHGDLTISDTTVNIINDGGTEYTPVNLEYSDGTPYRQLDTYETYGISTGNVPGELTIENSDVSISVTSYKGTSNDSASTAGTYASVVNIVDSNVDIKVNKNDDTDIGKKVSDGEHDWGYASTFSGIDAGHVEIDNSNVKVVLSEEGELIHTSRGSYGELKNSHIESFSNNKGITANTPLDIFQIDECIDYYDAYYNVEPQYNSEDYQYYLSDQTGFRIIKGKEVVIQPGSPSIPEEKEDENTDNSEKTDNNKSETNSSDRGGTDTDAPFTDEEYARMEENYNRYLRDINQAGQEREQYLQDLNSFKVSQRDYTKWGNGSTGVIWPYEYIFLSNLTNSISSKYGSVDKSTTATSAFIDALNEELPEDHPLHGLNNTKGNYPYVEFRKIKKMEAFVLRMSKDIAIVVFAGTNPKQWLSDIVGTDVAIALGIEDVQVDAANQLITELENDGVKQIYTTGHSLGGYLAVNTALKHPSVIEAVTFDAPGQSISQTNKSNKDENVRNVITNYISDGSIVNKGGAGGIGKYIGETYRFYLPGDKDQKYEDGGANNGLPYHSSEAMVDLFRGKKYSTNIEAFAQATYELPYLVKVQ